MSTLRASNIRALSGTAPPVIQRSDGTEVGEFCLAWVNFNGTGTVAIRASFNVTSITDSGVGLYAANFTNAMSDANYAAVTNCNPNGYSGAYGGSGTVTNGTNSASQVFIELRETNNNNVDSNYVFVAIFR
jgi:hypothetical protein